MEKLISASMLSADFGNLQQSVEMINRSKTDWFHLDIMDGIFVPNISYGFPVVKAIAKYAKKTLDAHLMIVEPDRYVAKFKEAGVEWLSIHYETSTHLHRSIQNIRNLGMKAGVAINPHTSVMLLEDIISDLDYVVLMSVNPGFGGQSFIENSIDKIARLKDLILKKGSECLIEVDGGVSLQNITAVKNAGADIFVAGNAIFATANPEETVERMKALII